MQINKHVNQVKTQKPKIRNLFYLQLIFLCNLAVVQGFALLLALLVNRVIIVNYVALEDTTYKVKFQLSELYKSWNV